MKRVVFLALGATLLMTVSASLQPAQAICNSARLIQSLYSYVYTPGYEDGSGFMDSTISENLVGAFWAIGSGDLATIGAGNDNGEFPALGTPSWLYVYPGFPASINSTWAASTAIDGCIDADPLVANEERCMAILLMDNDANTGSGAFALLTDQTDENGNYNFEQPSRGPINLVTVPSLSISGSVRTNSCSGSGVPCDTAADCTTGETCDIGTGVDVTVGGIDLSSIAAGLYLDANCPQPTGPDGARAIEGYQVYAAEVDRPTTGQSSPPGPAVENWTAVGPVTPLDADPVDVAPVSLVCTGNTDQYLAAGIVFESGSESRYVTGPSTRFECGANLAEPADLIERKPRGRKLPSRGSRSRGR